MVYCSFLLRRFVIGGGKVLKREVRGVEEVFALGSERIPCVVNASGIGFGDDKVFITRGEFSHIIYIDQC
jgi:hypothetical protein